MHTIKKKKRCALVLKIDLVKAFDQVNWTYLRIIMLQIGIPLLGVNWIMGCISSAKFSMLINGSPSGFFIPTRGVRQGFPLSPFSFLLVADALSRLILKARREGKIEGVKVSRSKEITHTLFVDDVLLFGIGAEDNMKEYASLI